jgi:hypothetical protein
VLAALLVVAGVVTMTVTVGPPQAAAGRLAALSLLAR